MSEGLDKIFAFKGGYAFGVPLSISLSEYLVQELMEQLHHLEQQWVTIYGLDLNLSPSMEIYRKTLDQVSFRLGEIIRFIQKTNGPKIVYWVCSELQEMLSKKIQFPFQPLPVQIQEQVGIIITAMNSYYELMSVGLNIGEPEPVIQHLKEATQKLIFYSSHY